MKLHFGVTPSAAVERRKGFANFAVEVLVSESYKRKTARAKRERDPYGGASREQDGKAVAVLCLGKYHLTDTGRLRVWTCSQRSVHLR